MCFFFFHDTATTEIYTYRHTLSLHDALPILEALSVDESCGRSASVSLSSLFPDSSRSSLVMLTVGAAVSYVSRAMRLPVTMIAPSAAGSAAAASAGASSCAKAGGASAAARIRARLLLRRAQRALVGRFMSLPMVFSGLSVGRRVGGELAGGRQAVREIGLVHPERAVQRVLVERLFPFGDDEDRKSTRLNSSH